MGLCLRYRTAALISKDFYCIHVFWQSHTKKVIEVFKILVIRNLLEADPAAVPIF